MRNNYSRYLDEIFEIYRELESQTETAKVIHEKYFPNEIFETVRRGVAKLIKRHSFR